MKPIKEMTQLEVGAFINEYLRSKGIDVVLTGGSAVMHYTDGKYVSRDLDFIEISDKGKKQIAAAMNELGFTQTTRHFVHPDTKVIIEFPKGPLSIGSEPVDEVVSVNFPTGKLSVISATDSVKDRLAGYYYFKDGQSLEQARLICMANQVDLAEVERWSRAERKLAEYQAISHFLGK